VPADRTAGERAEVNVGLLRDWPLPRHEQGGTKEGRGRVLVIGGATQTPGAVLLAAVAALRSGAGKLQIAVGASTAAHLAVAVPEAFVQSLPETPDGAISPAAVHAVAGLVEGAAAVLVGPGMADEDATCRLVSGVLEHCDGATVVLDALGLAAVERDERCLSGIPAVLTPNKTEMALMLDIDEDEVDADRTAAATTAARRFGAVVALGGGTTLIADPEGRVWHDSTGGVGLGVSGSGDVFAGIVTGLAARGAQPAQAAVWGAHLHGRAGDRLTGRIGRLGYLAREVADEVPVALAEIDG
jgi:ADP-dependent NAD(P)H-hydrate dehydratase